MKNRVGLYINSKFGEDIFYKIGLLKILNNKYDIKKISFKNENKSKNSLEDSKKNFFSKLLFFMQSYKLRNISSVFRYNVIRKDLNIILNFIFVTIFYPIFFKSAFIEYLKKKIFINESIEKFLNKNKVDYILIFCSIYGLNEYNLIKSARKKNIKTILVVDNWDNLASKITLIEKPDKLLVWGKEMDDCYKISKYLDKRKIQKQIIGSPRYAFIKSQIKKINRNYLNKKLIFEKKYKTLKEQKIILFLESIRERDPLKILKLLDKQINKDNLSKQVLIIYRPHPLRKKNIIDYKLLNSFKNIKVDKSIELLLKKSQLRDLKDEDVNIINFLYAESVIYCDGFISQISSAILDLMYLGKEGLLMSRGTPQKLFDGLHWSQCFRHAYTNIFKNKIIKEDNIDLQLNQFVNNIKKSKKLKSKSAQINYIIEDLDYNDVVKKLLANIS